MSIIAVDYDDTFTLSPKAFGRVITVMQNAGWKVICVTARPYSLFSLEEIMFAMPGDVDIFHTGYESKYEYMEALGIHVDVWVDDMPRFIDPWGADKKAQGYIEKAGWVTPGKLARPPIELDHENCPKEPKLPKKRPSKWTAWLMRMFPSRT